MTSELLSMATADGVELELDAYGGDLRFLVAGGYGLPPVDFVTFQGYKQVGETALAVVAQPRTVTAQMYRAPGCGREAYWTARADILDFFRNNRGGPLTLVIRLPDGALRNLSVRADPGPIFPPNDPAGSVWNLQEGLQFVAHDPVFFDPRPIEFTPVASAQSALVFPLTFPLTFGFPGPVFTTGPIVYDGTWPAWLWLRLRGPFTWARIVNSFTGAQILLSVPLAAGEYRTLDLRNSPVITDDLNVSRFSELGADSNLIDFPLLPPPASAQSITASMYGGTAESAFYCAVYRRFIGI